MDTQNTADIELPSCELPLVQDRDVSHIVNDFRANLIVSLSKMWVNGTTIKYYFFKQHPEWSGSPSQEASIRTAISAWKEVGIGLEFSEVDNPEEATIRIGFKAGDGSWSFVGRDCIDHASDPNIRTTNFGWDLSTPHGKHTALHEIGHALGLPHEHQNPSAGIVWDEDKVYQTYSQPPNSWSRDKIHWNIIRKLPFSAASGSAWDKDSVMHYQFPAGLIKQPSQFLTKALRPALGFSETDVKTIKRIYPPLTPQLPELKAFESERFLIEAGEQLDFVIKPGISRDYTLATFGKLDTMITLFEKTESGEEFLTADDDSGTDFNAQLSHRLLKGRSYVVRARLYYARARGEGSIMMF